jgi:hypothetical protein
VSSNDGEPAEREREYVKLPIVPQEITGVFSETQFVSTFTAVPYNARYLS